MITTASGSDVARFIDRLLCSYGRFARVLICSPFLDETLADTMRRLASALRGKLTIVTRPEAMRGLQLAARWGVVVVTHPHLHAKAFVAIGEPPCDSEAIVTSANLTESGLRRNYELGVKALATSPEGARLIAGVVRALAIVGH